MAKTTQIINVRTKVSGLIDDYGNSITLKTRGTATRDAWGKVTLSSQTSTSTVAVTDNYMLAKMNLTSAGRMNDGELLVLLKGTETFDNTYIIEVDSVDYNIMSIMPLKAADVTVAYEVILGRK